MVLGGKRFAGCLLNSLIILYIAGCVPTELNRGNYASLVHEASPEHTPKASSCSELSGSEVSEEPKTLTVVHVFLPITSSEAVRNISIRAFPLFESTAPRAPPIQ
jgi:hypothetical protein